jgi:hypothetical protein
MTKMLCVINSLEIIIVEIFVQNGITIVCCNLSKHAKGIPCFHIEVIIDESGLSVLPKVPFSTIDLVTLSSKLL